MLNGLRRVRPDEPFSVTADGWNTIVDAVTEWAQGRKDQPKPAGRLTGCVEALALNSTGAALREYKPAAVTAAGGYDLAEDTPAALWNRRPLLTLGEPTTATDWVCVTLEAIPAGAIGRVAISGTCLCDVDSASGAKWARPQIGDTDALLGGSTGTVRVLHVPSTGGSQRRCAVYLHERPGASEACGNLPLTFAVAVPGFSVTTTTAVVSGTTVLTGITLKQRLRNITITEDGCYELGEPYCADFEASCTVGEDPGPPASPSWYCLDGTCVEAYDGLEPAGSTGPYSSKTACVTACTSTGTVSVTCCENLLPETLFLALSGGNGTVSMVWNGTSWRWTGTLPCGPAVIFNYSTACEFTWSTDGGETFTGIPGDGSRTCVPFGVTGLTISGLGGTCGTLTGTISV